MKLQNFMLKVQLTTFQFHNHNMKHLELWNIA